MIYQESETVELRSIIVDDIKNGLCSEGGFVSGITLKDVMMGIPVCRNVKLVNVFYRLEFIEAYGTGILKIMEVYAGTGKEPKIETSDNTFKIILLIGYHEKNGLRDSRLLARCVYIICYL